MPQLKKTHGSRGNAPENEDAHVLYPVCCYERKRDQNTFHASKMAELNYVGTWKRERAFVAQCMTCTFGPADLGFKAHDELMHRLALGRGHGQKRGVPPRTMLMSISRMRAPSSRMPECMYSFVTHCLMPWILSAVRCASSKSTYLPDRTNRSSLPNTQSGLNAGKLISCFHRVH